MELFKLFGTIAINNSEANKDIDNTTEKASDAGKKMSGALKKVGAAVGTFLAVDKIKDFGKSCIESAASVKAASSQFEQTFGELSGSANLAIMKVASSSNILGTRLQGVGTSIHAFAKTAGMKSTEALSMMERALQVTADSAAYYDRSLEDTSESLKSFLKGNFENDAALGLSCTETTRNAKANELYGQSFKDLSEAQKQLTLLAMVEDANRLSGAMGQAAREGEGWENVTGNLNEAWKQFQATVGAPILEKAVSVVQWLTDKIVTLDGAVEEGSNPVQIFIDKLQNFWGKCKEVGDYTSVTLQPIITDLQTVFTAAKDALQPFIDKFTEYVSSGEGAEDITNAVKNAIDLLAAAYQTAKDMIKDVVQSFKDAVTWGKEHETAVALIAIAVGTLTAAIVAYNIAAAIKKSGGIAEIAQLGIMQVQIWALTAAETAHTAVTAIATAATSAFGAVMAFITSPITLVVLAIGALIAIGVLLYKNWDTIKEKCLEVAENLKAKWEEIKTAVSEKVESIKEAISEKFNAVKESVISIFESVKETLSSVWETICNAVQVAIMLIGEIISAAFQIITLPWRFIWENCKEYIFAAWDAIKNAVSAALDAIKNVISTVWNAIGSFLAPILESIRNTVSNAWSSIQNAVSTVLTAIHSFVSTIWAAITAFISSAMAAIQEVVSSIWNAIVSAVNSSLTAMQTFITTVWTGIKSTITTVMTAIQTTVSNVWNTVKTKVSEVITGIKAIISTGLNAAKSTVTSIFESIRSTINSKIEAAKNIVSTGIEKLKSFFNFSWELPKLKMPHFSISGSFSLNPPSVPSFGIEWYKKAMNNPMVMDSPTIFGYNAATGQMMGGGEAGSEVISGTNTLMSLISAAVASQNGAVIAILTKILEALLTMDDNMGGHLREALDDMSLVVNKREFARLVNEVT